METALGHTLGDAYIVAALAAAFVAWLFFRHVERQRRLEILHEVLAGDVPQLSPAFDTRVMQRLRPRPLATVDRIVIASYGVVAAATTAWLMRDVPIELVFAAIVVAAPIAAGVSAYGRRLAFGS